MKSFFAYPAELKTLLHPADVENISAGKQVAHCELFRMVCHLNGAVVKCGIDAEEGFTRFISFCEVEGCNNKQKMIAFEKSQAVFEQVNSDGELKLKVKHNASIGLSELERAGWNNIEFVPGAVFEAIPNYLIENPELKISLLNIDLDDYDASLTSLEFLYPRLMPGGMLILDNFHCSAGEQKAVKDYFWHLKVQVNNFSVNTGPHYIVKP